MSRFLPIALFFFLVTAAAQAPQSPQRSGGVTVSGSVRNVPSESSGVTRTVSLVGGDSGGATVAVKTDGSFTFENIRPGAYTLMVTGGIPALRSQPLEIQVADKDIDGLELVVPESFPLSGRITIEGGGLLPALSLTFIPYSGGQSVSSAMSSSATGQFTVRLTEGDYRISWNQLPAGYFVKSVLAGTDDVLTKPLRIVAGNTASVEMVLGVSSPPPWVKVSGRVTGGVAQSASSGQRGASFAQRVTLTRENQNSAIGQGFAASPLPPQAQVSPDGSFEFPMVPPGLYRATVTPSSVGMRPVSLRVSTTDVTDLHIAGAVPREITGRVIVERNGPVPRFTFSITNTSGSNSSLAETAETPIAPPVQADGTFKVTLPESGFRLKVNTPSLPPGYSLKSVTYGDLNLLRETLNLADAGKELRIAFGAAPNSWFKVAGTVSGLNSIPSAAPPPRGFPSGSANTNGRTVVLAPTTPNRLAVSSLTALVGADGSFEFPMVVAGDYSVRLNPSVNGMANVSLTVGNKDVTGLQIDVPKLRAVTGRVTVERDGPMPRFSLTLAAETAGVPPATSAVVPDAAGAFTVTVLEGARRATIPTTTLPPGYTLRSFTYGSTDLTREDLSISGTDTAELHVTFGTAPNSWFKVSGTVSGLNNVPAPPPARGIARGAVVAGAGVTPPRGGFTVGTTTPTVVLTGTTLSSRLGVSSLTANVGADGAFEFPMVFPGEYSVRLNPTVNGVANVSVTVRNKDVTNIQFGIPKTRTMTGRVVVEGDGPMPRFSLTLASETAGVPATTVAVVPDAAGLFSITVPEGARRATIPTTTLPPGYTLQSLTYGSTDLIREALNVSGTGTAELHVTFGTAPNSWFKVSGTVSGLSNVPPPPARGAFARGAAVVAGLSPSGGLTVGATASRTVVLTGTTLTSRLGVSSLTANVGADGSFEFPMIFPGEYSLRLNPTVNGVANVSVTVRNKDVTNVQFGIPKTRAVTGRVVVEGDGPMPRFSLSLAAEIAGVSATTIAVTPDAAGAFTVTVPEGVRRVTIPTTTLPPGYTLTAWTYGSTDLLRDALSISGEETAELRVVFGTTPNLWFKISGTVSGLGNLAPPAGARGGRGAAEPRSLVLSGTGLPRGGFTVASPTATIGPDGSFEFSKVFSGEYTIRLNPTAVDVPAMTVTVKDRDLTGIRFDVPERAPLRGRIVVEGGAPVPRVSFTVSNPSGNPTTITPQPDATFSVSLPTGERRFTVVTAALPPGYSVKSATMSSTDLLQSTLNLTVSNTAEIVVTLAVAPDSLFKVSGRVTGIVNSSPSVPAPRGRGATTAPLNAQAPNAVTLTSTLALRPLTAPINADGSFEFPAVFRGTFTLNTVPTNASAGSTVTVVDKDITNLRVENLAERPVRGRVVVENNGPMPRFSILVNPARGNNSTRAITAQTDGAFTLALPPGETAVAINPGSLPPGYAVKSFSYGATDLLNSYLQLAATGDPAELRVVFSVAPNSFFKVKGRVTGLDQVLSVNWPPTALPANLPADLPADLLRLLTGGQVNLSTTERPAFTVTLSEPAPQRFAWSPMAPLQSDGSFEFPAIPRGTYTLAGVATGVPLGSLPITVSGNDVSGIELAAQRMRIVAGRATVDGGGTLPAFVIEGNARPLPLLRDADGGFKIAVPEGDTRLTFSGLSQFRVKSATSGNTNLAQAPLKVAERTPDILLTLAAPPGFKVSGRITGLPPQSEAPVITIGGTTTPIAITMRLRADGSFEFDRVTEGLYTVSLGRTGAPSMPLARLAVFADTTLEAPAPANLTAVLTARTITGRVVIQGNDKPDLSRMVVTFSSDIRVSTGTMPDASFRALLSDGSYSISAKGLPEGYAVKSIVAGTANAMDNPFVVTATSFLTITIGVGAP